MDANQTEYMYVFALVGACIFLGLLFVCIPRPRKLEDLTPDEEAKQKRQRAKQKQINQTKKEATKRKKAAVNKKKQQQKLRQNQQQK